MLTWGVLPAAAMCSTGERLASGAIRGWNSRRAGFDAARADAGGGISYGQGALRQQLDLSRAHGTWVRYVYLQDFQAKSSLRAAGDHAFLPTWDGCGRFEGRSWQWCSLR